MTVMFAQTLSRLIHPQFWCFMWTHSRSQVPVCLGRDFNGGPKGGRKKYRAVECFHLSECVIGLVLHMCWTSVQLVQPLLVHFICPTPALTAGFRRMGTYTYNSTRFLNSLIGGTAWYFIC
jgi:hypothetical protein